MNDLAENKPLVPIVQFKRDMDNMVAKELDMLDDKAKSRMKNAAVVAVTKDPDLLLADRSSFMMAIRMCASHGVIPDGNEAVLQVYNTKAKGANGQEIWIKKVTYLPMIRGIVNRVLRSGKVNLFWADVVYEGEQFTIDTSNGDRKPLHIYDPMRRGDDKNIIGAYSVAVNTNGTTDCEVMPLSEIQKVRNAAKTKNVWDGWFSEKAKVAVMKRHSKRLQLSAEDMDFIQNRDETDFDQSPRDVTPEPSAPRVNLAQRLQNKPQDSEALTGEVMPPEEDELHWTASVPYGEAFPGSDAFSEGAKAFVAGLKVIHCPHEADRNLAIEWIGGWMGAQEAKA